MKKINWRYAFGELLIVTAGISLAFALNSISENQKEENKKLAYLEGISTDLSEDIKALDSTTAVINDRLKILYAMMPYLKGKEVGKDSVMIRFFSVIDPVKFRPQESTLQSLKFSGDLRLIENLELRTEIVGHYEDYNLVNDEFERHMSFSRDFVAEYFMNNLNYLNVGEAEVFDDQYFRNIVFALIGIYRLNLDRQTEALDRAKNIRDAISAELNVES